VARPEGELKPEAVERLRLGLQIMALRALGDPDAAEEAVQETMVRALEALRDGRPSDPDKLGAFVRGIARHVIADTHRARQRSAPLQAVPEGELGTSKDDPLTTLITAEERHRVRLALTRLSAGDRQILHLSFFEGLTPAAIAERLGEPALRVRKRKSRALARLRRALLPGPSTRHEWRSSTTRK
jgi:RNA polymerase sigma-70 factor (ECF subfamily)